MTRALVAIHNTTYGGVYYSDNIDFTDLATQPTWARLSTTGLANLLVKVAQYEPGDPYNQIYLQLDNDDVYHWNGVSWTKILDVATAITIYGDALDTVGYIAIDTSAPGTIYYPCQKGVTSTKLLKSTDYGANWTAIDVVTGIVSGTPFVQAYGQNIIVNWTGAVSYIWRFSTNGGAAWTQIIASFNAPFKQDQFTPTNAYCTVSGADYNLARVTSAGQTTLQNTYVLGIANRDRMWIDPVAANHHRILRIYNNNVQLFSTIDAWSNLVDTTPDVLFSGATLFGALAAALEDNNNILVGFQNTSGAGAHRVYAMYGESASSWSGISGPNYNSSPYADSIPAVSGVYVAVDGIWVGEAPADKGVFVYADELGDITDIPDYDGLGQPMFGDRASWRDRPDEGFDIYHAEDVQRDERQIHTPEPTGNDGYGIIEVDGFWVNSSDVMVTGAGGGLTVTEIDGVPSIAATTLEFPNGTVTDEGGGTARYTPTTPAHALDDHTDVDLTGAAQGDIIYDNAGTWEDYPLGIGTNVVNTGTEIRLGDVAGGDYVAIDTTTGEVGLVGAATAFEDIQVTLTIRDTGATTYNPSFSKWFDDAAGTSRGVYVYGFDDHHTNEKELFFTCQFRHAQRLNALIHPHVHWIGKSSQNSKKVQWGLEYTWKSPGQVYGDTVFEYANTPISGNVDITAGLHEITELADLLPDDTCNDLSSILIGRLFRNSKDTVNDTYTDDVGLLAIDFHVEINSFGSNLEYSKTEPTPPVPPSQGIIPVQVFADLDNMTGPLLDDGSDKLVNEIMS